MLWSIITVSILCSFFRALGVGWCYHGPFSSLTKRDFFFFSIWSLSLLFFVRWKLLLLWMLRNCGKVGVLVFSFSLCTDYGCGIPVELNLNLDTLYSWSSRTSFLFVWTWLKSIVMFLWWWIESVESGVTVGKNWLLHMGLLCN